MNKIPKYHQTPEGIMYFLQLFHQHNISYLLFKCDHIFAGQNKNLDILFETDIDYKKASFILEQHEFIIQLSENVERYKTMYVGFYKNAPLSIHLHREVAWHGIKALDKSPLFEHKQTINPLIVIPNLEDSILIHTAHILFENFKITPKELIYLSQIDNKNINIQYIREQIKKNNWRKGFNKVIKAIKKNKTNLSKKIILTCLLEKLIKEPVTTVYIIKKAIKKILRPITNTKRGTLIALIGVNGSGKSTLARKLLLVYEPLTKHLNIPQEQIYFGWKPQFFLTKILSRINKETNMISFKKLNLKKKKEEPKFSIGQECLFVYIFLEYMYRYYIFIHPKLKKNYLLITDRYFYDIYGQYSYAKKSIILPFLLKIFPKPDRTYILDVEIKELINRKKTDKDQKTQKIIVRNVFPKKYLKEQREQYQNFSKANKLEVIDNNLEKRNKEDKPSLEENIKTQTWKEIVQEK